MLLINSRPFIRNIYVNEWLHSQPQVIARDCRLFYVVKGSLNLCTFGSCYNMTEGSLIIFKAGLSYTIDAGGSPGAKFIVVNFDYTMNHSSLDAYMTPRPVYDFKPCDIIEDIVFEDCLSLNKPLFIKDLPPAEAQLLGIENEYRLNLPYRLENMSVSLLSLIIFAVRIADSSFTGKKAFSNMAEKTDMIIKYVNENYNKEISNRLLASQLNYHPNYINRAVKNILGLTLHRYVLSVRLGNAVKMLLFTDKTISEVAFDTGFKDLSHFTICFKKKTGFSPSEYRKKHYGV